MYAHVTGTVCPVSAKVARQRCNKLKPKSVKILSEAPSNQEQYIKLLHSRIFIEDSLVYVVPKHRKGVRCCKHSKIQVWY